MNYQGKTFTFAILAIIIVAGIWIALLPASLRKVREDAAPSPSAGAAFIELQAKLQEIRTELQAAPLLKSRSAAAIPSQIMESLQGKIGGTVSSSAR